MTIEQFDLLLTEMYEIDISRFFYRRKRDEFEKSSYFMWAVDEVKQYVTDGLHPRKEGSIQKIENLVKRFQKMVGGGKNQSFQIAADAAEDILDLLSAME